jgi:WD40 repeat protein
MQQTPSARGPLVVYNQHYESIYSVAWSPDGKTIICANSYNGDVVLWDTEHQEELTRFRPNRVVHIVAWSPDGQQVALAERGMPGTVRVWQLATRDYLSSTQDTGHNNTCQSLGWSPDGIRIASSSQHNSVQIWDAHTGQGMLNYLLPPAEQLISVAWSPVSEVIAVATYTGTVRVWDARSGETLVQLSDQHHEGFVSLAWSPDGRYIASSSFDLILVWEALTGKIVTRLPYQPASQIDLAWSPDGQRLASNAFSGQALVWNPFNGEVLACFADPTASASNLSWSPDGRTIASAGEGIFLWESATGNLLHVICGEPAAIYNVRPSPDASIVASLNHYHIHFWDARMGTRLQLCGDMTRFGIIGSFSWSPDNKRIVTAHCYGAVVVWQAIGERFHMVEPLVYEAGGDMQKEETWHISRETAWSPDGKRIAIARDNKVQIWDDEARRISLIYEGHVQSQQGREYKRNWVRSLAWSPDSQYLVSCAAHTVHVWHVSSGKQLLVYRARESRVEFQCVAWSPDGKALAVAHGNLVHVWHAYHKHSITLYRGHQQQQRLDETDTSSEDLQWETPTRQYQVRVLAWSPDGTMLASATEGSETVHIWRVGYDQLFPYIIYRGHPHSDRPLSEIHDVRWFPDGQHLVSSVFEAHIWRLPQ